METKKGNGGDAERESVPPVPVKSKRYRVTNAVNRTLECGRIGLLLMPRGMDGSEAEIGEKERNDGAFLNMEASGFLYVQEA